MSVDLSELKQIKDLSDRKQYQEKGKALHRLMVDYPEQFQVDTTEGRVPGITHIPTGFQFHIPWEWIPAQVGARSPAELLKQVKAGSLSRPVQSARYILQDELRMWASTEDSAPFDTGMWKARLKACGLGQEEVDSVVNRAEEAWERKQASVPTDEELRDQTETEPSKAQIRADNYRRAHVRVQGLELSIENPRGSVRKGVGPNGPWESTMTHSYGYIRGYGDSLGLAGKDGDHPDCFLGPDPDSDRVWVVDQLKAPEFDTFDEVKVLLGFNSQQEAKQGYLSNYEQGWKGIGQITECTMDQLKDWMDQGCTPHEFARFMDQYADGAVGIDLDGTLALDYEGPFDKDRIGDPDPKWARKVRRWLRNGREVRIFTARAHDPENVPPIRAWCEEHFGQELPVTNVKTPDLAVIFDDRAREVVKSANEAQNQNPFLTHLNSDRYFGREGSVVRAEDILQAAQTHGVDPRLLASIVANESAWGTAPNAVRANNFTGIMGVGSTLHTYETPAQGLSEAASLLRRRYIDRGLTTPQTIGPVYAPTQGATNDPNGMNNDWIPTVSSIMSRIPAPAQAPTPTPQPTPPPTPQPTPVPTPVPTPQPRRLDADTVGNQVPEHAIPEPPAVPDRSRLQLAPPDYTPTQDNPPSDWEHTPGEGTRYWIPKQGSQRAVTGPLAILQALSEIDLDRVEEENRELAKKGPKSKRPKAIQRLGIIQGLRRNEATPRDLMVHKVPVIPPQFRPFSAQGDTFIPGDANVLYKELMDMKEAYQGERTLFGDEGAGRARGDLYRAVKALYGYGDPVGEKSRAKGVSGFMQKVLGANPKVGFFHRRLLGKTQDSVARGVITVDPELGMDEVGLPESMAWTMYGPYIQRRLVQAGMAPGKALESVRDRTEYARKALEREMGERPVIYSRAPVWHKYGIISGKPKLVEGDSIVISPFVTEGSGSDFDGDTMNMHLPSTSDAVQDARTKLKPSNMLLRPRNPEQIMGAPKHEQILGLHSALRRPSTRTHQFPSEEAALQAIRSGAVPLRDEIEIVPELDQAPSVP